MERYLVDVTNLRLDDQEQPQTSADGTPKARMYLAAPVDARIAELEKVLRLCFFNMYPNGTTFEDAYADSLKAANELMESVTNVKG